MRTLFALVFLVACSGSGGASDAAFLDGGREGDTDGGARDGGADDTGIDGGVDAGPPPPVLHVDFPVSSAWAPSTTLRFAGRAEGATRVLVAGALADTVDGFATWSATVSLESGWNEVSIVAESPEGLTTSVERRVLLRPRMGAPLAQELADGVLSVVTQDPAALVEVTMASGVTEIVADLSAMTTSDGRSPVDLALDSGRAFLLSAAAGDSVTAGVWTLSDGMPTPFSDATHPAVDGGPTFVCPDAMELDAARDRLLVHDPCITSIVAVDLDDGARTAFSTHATSEVPVLDHFMRLGLDSSGGRLLAAAARFRGMPGLYAVDLTTGTRSLLSDNTGMGFEDPAFLMEPQAVVRRPEGGAIHLFDRFAGLMRLDGDGTNRTLLASSEVVGRGVRGLDVDGSDVVFVSAVTHAVLRVGPEGAVTTLTENAFPTRTEVQDGRHVAASDDGLFIFQTSTALVVLEDGAFRVLALSSEEEGDGPVALGEAAYVLRDVDEGRILARVDLETGALTVVSRPSEGAPDVGNAQALVLDEAHGRAFVSTEREVVAIDLATGARTLAFTAADAGADEVWAGLFEGERLVFFAWDESSGASSLQAWDAASGTFTELSGSGDPGPPLVGAYGLTRRGESFFTASEGRLLRIDATTGARSDAFEGASMWRVLPSGSALFGMADEDEERLVQLDPETGREVLLVDVDRH
ncbi:MAG: hypothetical protein KC586_00785 [Myxococcales bacterium]|nr:hypothetical protein [Myxococcales bacterium]